LEKGVEHVIITLGARGIYMRSLDSKANELSKEGLYVHAMKATAGVADTTGAGDTFLGGFAARLAGLAVKPIPFSSALLNQQLGPSAAIGYGAHAAAMSVERHGAQSSIPTVAEVKQDEETNKFRDVGRDSLVGDQLLTVDEVFSRLDLYS
jgi:ribokinase